MKEIILTADKINEITKRIGKQLSDRLRNSDSAPVFVCVMKGGLNFMMDLIKEVDIPMMTDYIQISSYEGTGSTGVINFKKDLTIDVTGKTVVIVEDIIDTGYSLSYLKKYLESKYKIKELIICCLFDKKPARKVEVKVDYVGCSLEESKFLMGYGLDYYEYARNINCVFVPDEKELQEYDRLLAK